MTSETSLIYCESCHQNSNIWLDIYWRWRSKLKTHFFVPFVRPCMHHNYGVISGSHACRDCV